MFKTFVYFYSSQTEDSVLFNMDTSTVIDVGLKDTVDNVKETKRTDTFMNATDSSQMAVRIE